MKTDIDLVAEYPHPAERVWAALTSSEALAAWLMPKTSSRWPGTRTRLRMHQVGFDGLAGQLTRRILASGWPGILRQRLAAYLGQPAGRGTREHTARCDGSHPQWH
jgi:hypothetical protein